ncbi:response regulator transcription factor [Pseudomonas mosselii]|uniref:response regulator transcription factor n=1 Tax=Pseudomonas mosselii TaxID=78327 RepID=UPI002DBAE7C5|nr:response regulator transcription factor [Pseudomonas mosselii]MEB5932415.1 response regulator transcription factor [Pseudomonas mosselii]
MSASSAVIRVAVLDDHAVVRCGVVARIGEEPDIRVVGSYASSVEMIAGLRTAPADVLLVDYTLSPNELDGISLIRALTTKFPASRVLIFSSHNQPAIASLAMRVGASGFIGKTQDVAHMISGIRSVAKGMKYIDPDMTYRLVEATVDLPLQRAPSSSVECNAVRVEGVRLTAKESEVIRCFLSGLTVSEIARKFARSEKTISSQKWSAFRKLGVTSDGELFNLKLQSGVF